jgi:hypothetical protein
MVGRANVLAPWCACPSQVATHNTMDAARFVVSEPDRSASLNKWTRIAWPGVEGLNGLGRRRRGTEKCGGKNGERHPEH